MLKFRTAFRGVGGRPPDSSSKKSWSTNGTARGRRAPRRASGAPSMDCAQPVGVRPNTRVPPETAGDYRRAMALASWGALTPRAGMVAPQIDPMTSAKHHLQANDLI